MFPRKANRFHALAATALTALGLTVAAPIAAPTALGVVTAAAAQQPAQFTEILARYGAFQPHTKYGEVWVPARETVPEGWHPYPPCNWVHSKDLGWYFNDTTEWGKIIHHYGRWAHDKNLGWVWVRGEEFSPAWVVWRTSDKWVGWAPLPPEQDIREISATDFNSDKHWIFVDAKKFAATCNGGTTLVSAPPALYPVILTETRLVTEIRFVRGIAIFVLPPPLIFNIVDIDIHFHPWSPCFFGAWFWNWNWMVNTIIINVNLPPAQCQPVPKQLMPIPIKSTPPPAPGGKPPPDRRADLPPPVSQPDKPRYDPPRQVDPPVKLPPVVQLPPRLPPPVINDRTPPIKVPPIVDRTPPIKLPPVGERVPPRTYEPPKTPPRIVDKPPRKLPDIARLQPNTIKPNHTLVQRSPVPRLATKTASSARQPIPRAQQKPVIR